MAATEALHATPGWGRSGFDNRTSKGSSNDNRRSLLSLVNDMVRVSLYEQCGVDDGRAAALILPNVGSVAVLVNLSRDIVLRPPSGGPKVTLVAALVSTDVLRVKFNTARKLGRRTRAYDSGADPGRDTTTAGSASLRRWCYRCGTTSTSGSTKSRLHSLVDTIVGCTKMSVTISSYMSISFRSPKAWEASQNMTPPKFEYELLDSVAILERVAASTYPKPAAVLLAAAPM